MRFFDLKSGASASPSRTVAALGYFDGVHIGHRALLQKTCELAERLSAVPAVWTFENGIKDYGLCSPEEKLRLIADCGIKLAAVCDFSEFRDMSAESFTEEFLIDRMRCVGAVCGYNFRFGKGASSGTEELAALLERSGAVAVTVPEVKFRGETVSSSAIRAALKAGDTEKASALLGRRFCIRAEVSHGKGLGKKLGFPTVNQDFFPDALYPRLGVYCVSVLIDGQEYCGVANIGKAPSVTDGGKVRAETYILNFDSDVYGKQIRTELLRFMRDERKFSSEKELAAAIADDIISAKKYFGLI